MGKCLMNRREFIHTTAIAAAISSIAPFANAADSQEKPSGGVNWPIGRFNRPWAGDKKNWGYDVALDGIKAAGYKLTGLLTRTAGQPLAGSDATPEYLADLKKKISARGLGLIMAAVRTKDELPLDGQIKDMRKQIDNSKFLEVQFLLTFGVNKSEHYENYYSLMRDAA